MFFLLFGLPWKSIQVPWFFFLPSFSFSFSFFLFFHPLIVTLFSLPTSFDFSIWSQSVCFATQFTFRVSPSMLFCFAAISPVRVIQSSLDYVLRSFDGAWSRRCFGILLIEAVQSLSFAAHYGGGRQQSLPAVSSDNGCRLLDRERNSSAPGHHSWHKLWV
jgi:hypothetical protein